MRVFTCDHHAVVLPPGHRFPMEKYARLRVRLLETGVLAPDEVVRAEPAPLERVRAVHAGAYVDAVLAGTLDADRVRRLGFPWSEALVRRTLASVGGTLAAADAALEDGFGGNLAGGTHHAFADFGAGYCVFNDLAVATRALLDAGRVERVLVFDVDVHQGDGTAHLFRDEPRVFTCSLHGARNFPARKQASDLDVPLDDGTGDAEYLEVLERTLATALERARPDLLLYQGGVDALAEDRLGRLALTHAGLAERDRLVLGTARERGLPVALTLGGGYAEPIDASIEAHVGTYRVLKSLA